MAQAARLNLRMQKELKLLLTDPPPGVSFPFLSDAAASSSSSLSSIDSHVEGPEGTVYANGVFHIKIQIPERYPFQPPSVTFATPIYHPNIDTGGRICLDILNLPPKGAWQPSLNISTVLTSIGLLLSEPNPDDGLMCEASREYKYNRQIFDQKARSMTEKYAKAGTSESSGCSPSILSSSRPSMMESERPNKVTKCEVISQTLSQKKSRGISRKLSLECSGSSQEMECDGKLSKLPNHLAGLSNCENQMEVEGRKNESDGKVDGYNLTREKLSGTRRKLSLECLSQSQKRDADIQENVLPNTHPSALKPQSNSMASSESSSGLQASNHHTHHHQDQYCKSESKSLSLSSKKLCQVGQRPSLGSVDMSQNVGERDNQKHHVTPQLFPSEFHSTISDKDSSQPQVGNNNVLKPLAEAEPIGGSRHNFTNTKCTKLSTVGKKLSLRFKKPSQVEETDNKENVMPMYNTLLSQDGDSYVLKARNFGTSMTSRHGSGQKLSLEPPLHSQGSNDKGQHSLDLSTPPLKSIPMSEDSSCDWKTQSSKDRNAKIAGQMKEQELEKSPIADGVIVLDSEDSEEERNEALRPKLSIARKRLVGKWRAKV